jgi:hypothetical protein
VQITEPAWKPEIALQKIGLGRLQPRQLFLPKIGNR